MLFNRHGLQQKNWRMVKKGKHILFGCSLFFVVGGMSVGGLQVANASETNSSEVIAKEGVVNNITGEKLRDNTSILEKEKSVEGSNDKAIEKTTQNQDIEKSGSNASTKNSVKKEVNKKELKDLVDKIKKTDISKKTEKSVKELSLILSRVEKALDNKEITQEEIDKEVKALKEAFEKLEDKPEKEKVSEAKEKAESKKEEKSDSGKENSEKTQEGNKEDFARKHNEKITKVTETVTEIHSIANQINYKFSDAEKELVKTADKLPTFYNSDKYNEEIIQKLLKEVIYLRNKVANRMTRAHSGKRDPRNGQPINGNGESRFRAVYFEPTKNQHGRGEAGLVDETRTDLTYYNSDEIYSFMKVIGKRGPGEPLYKYQYGENRGKEDRTPYYLKTIGVISGLDKLKGITLRVAYINPRTGKEDFQDITGGLWNVNNPEVKAVIRGWLGRYDKTGEAVEPGDYRVTIAAGRQRPENSITYTFHVKAQSERNTVSDLTTPTYVDDVRHLTETEKMDLIKKFEAAHPGVVNRPVHVDYDHAEVSADGATMTIHFKDGFAPKTIQTNAQNDVEAKHSSLTTLVGDPHEFYKNPRNLVKSKTNHEVPQTARVTWKTPFDFSQPGTKNAVVTVSYDNGVTKDVTTPYTVLDFIGKQDKRIYQNQSGELGDARSYIKLSNETAPATDLTIRWKGGSSVDTSAQGIQRKEIEILRGNTVMKTVTIPVEIVDNINPTITAPDSVLLTRAEGLPSNISIDAQDNARGIGLKDANPIVVENLANPLRYNPSTKRIELSGVIPNNFQRTQATIKAIDKNGNTATKTITFNVQAQTDKYNAVPNSEKQTVSYGATPDAGTSVNKTNLPANTTYTWATTPSTTIGPGDKVGVVTVTYPDGSKDTVNVTIAVRKLSDEHDPTGTKIVRNQNAPVTNNDLKAAVTINNNGNSKVKSVTPVGTISTVNAGNQTIRAKVTYLDDTSDFVDIPLEVKDVTAPTIQTPNDRQNWDLIALDRTLPSITVTSVDNNGGTGIKSTTVTGLPDFLVYDNATKTIKFKNGVQEVTKLPVGQNSKTYNATIQVTDNANNPSQRQITITVKSMTTKYNATPNGQKQTVSYGTTPDAGTSVNKSGLPAGTRYTWATMPSTITGPGDKAGVVTVTYPDDSTDTVNVTVNVRRLADEYVPTGTKITREQNTAVTNDDLKAAVTISNNGNNKVKSVTPVGTISTAEFGNQTINATVTYLDDTTDSVTIPLEVRDVTKPTIQTPADRQNWDLIALDRTIPSIKVAATDNPGGSGIKSTTVTGLPNFLTYDEVTKTIKFKNGVQEVIKLPEGTDVQPHNITIEVEDNAGNKTSTQVTITVKSMTTKYDATANPDKQTVSYGATPDAGTSVNNSGLPEGTKYKWKTTPDTNTPGEKDGVVEVTYKDGSKDTVNVKVNVNKLSDEYNVTGAPIEVNQNNLVTNDDLKAKVTATPKEGNVSGTDKISTVVPKLLINTANYGDQNISATVTFKDGTTKDVTIPLKVKDVTNPTIQAPTNGQNWDLIAVEGQDPNIAVTSEDNAGGSGVKTTTVTGLPDFLVYDEATKTIKFKTGVTKVPSLPEGTDVETHNVTITVVDNAGNETSTQVTITVKSMTTKYEAAANPDKQTVSYGATPDAGTSVDKTNLPEGTSYAWKIKPDTNTPGEKDGVVEVTYKDGSKDTVNVKVNVNKLSDEYNVTATEIEVNQNTPVTNDDLKAKVTATSKVGNVTGTDKISTVVPTSPISTANYGDQTISAVVTFKDGTTKDVTIPLKVKDVTDPTIQTPSNGQNWDLIAVEGENPNIAVTSEDNAGGSGVKSTTVTGLPDFLEYNESTKMIQFKAGITSVPKLPEGIDVEPHNVTITVVDNAGNETSTQVTITVKSMTTKYEATANPDKQTVSYGEELDAGASINKSDLPAGTNYTWETKPSTTQGPGDKVGVVTVTYPDGSKDTVNVTVNVRALNDEYDVAGVQIEVNQNAQVTNDKLKAKVTATSKEGNLSGTDKISKVEPKAEISTANYGDQNITAIVTFKDGTTKEVTIPLKVKDVTPPTIQAPIENTNWEMTALDKTLPNMEVRAEDNANGSGVKTVSVEGLPDYLEYDSATNSIKFKAGKQEVEKLPENTPSKEFNLNIRVEDNAGNVSERTAKITVSSISTKTNPQPEDQTVKYGQTPNPEDSVNKQGLPDGTTVTWKTPPVVNAPGSTTGEVEITYPDGSKDVVTVNVTVRKVSEEFTATGTQIEVNQNAEVTSDMLKGAVNATNAQGENGNAKIAKVESKSSINTVAYGNQTIQAKVTYIDGSEQDVTIPLNVKDVTDPTILTPEENKNWEITALDKTLPVMKIKAEDNANGSGIATIEVRNLPEFLAFDESTGTIVFKEGVQEVPKIKSDNTMYGVTIIARDKAGNSTSMLVNITVWSMRGKYNPQPKAQTVDNGTVPNAEDSVDKTGLPSGTTITWKETPVVNTPGSHPTVALVTYPDGTVDEVEVPITVKEQKDTFNPTAKQPGQTAKHGSDPSAEGSINTEGLPSGTTYTWVEKPDTNTTPGSKPGKVLITYPDNSTEEVPVTVEVTPQKDDYDPQPKAQTITNGDVPNANESIENVNELPEGTRVEWKNGIVPNTDTPGSVSAKITITYPDNSTDDVDVTITVNKQTAKGDPEEQPTLPEFNGGVNGDPEIQPEVQKNKLIITKWIDENGNELKPTDAKYPKVLGEVNEAFEHGDIEGYEFVRTEVNKSGDIVMHIFRKRPNNGVGKVHNIEEILTPTGAKKVNLEKSSRIEKTSKRLANTGETNSSNELAGFGLAIVGLFVAIKRRKNEEE